MGMGRCVGKGTTRDLRELSLEYTSSGTLGKQPDLYVLGENLTKSMIFEHLHQSFINSEATQVSGRRY